MSSSERIGPFRFPAGLGVYQAIPMHAPADDRGPLCGAANIGPERVAATCEFDCPTCLAAWKSAPLADCIRRMVAVSDWGILWNRAGEAGLYVTGRLDPSENGMWTVTKDGAARR